MEQVCGGLVKEHMEVGRYVLDGHGSKFATIIMKSVVSPDVKVTLSLISLLHQHIGPVACRFRYMSTWSAGNALTV